jgi:dihydroxy-acid dehydratase
LDLNVSDKILEQRRSQWKARELHFESGNLWKYAQTVGPAHLGAVTHPGGKKEKRIYSDI